VKMVQLQIICISTRIKAWSQARCCVTLHKVRCFNESSHPSRCSQGGDAPLLKLNVIFPSALAMRQPRKPN
jgi:hypothetical protein